MKKILFLIFALSAVFSIPSMYGQSCGCSNCPVSLPDNGSQDFFVNVSGADNNDLAVNNSVSSIVLTFDHEYLGDLQITATSPAGQTITLVGDIGFYGATDFTDWVVTFVPAAATAVPDPGFSATWANNQAWGTFGSYTGSYYPFAGSLEDFNMGAVNGTWTFNVLDDQTLDVGDFIDFQVNFTDPVSSTTGTGFIACSSNPPCNVTSTSVSIGTCTDPGTSDPSDDTFVVTADFTFTDATSNDVTLDGVLMTDNGGGNYTITLPADGANNPGIFQIGDGSGNCTIDFADFASPGSCSPLGCDADPGTFTSNLNANNLVCNLGDQAGIKDIVLNTVGDYNAAPNDPCGVLTPGSAPGVIYLLYSAPPTQADWTTDPAFITSIGTQPAGGTAGITQNIEYGAGPLSFGSTLGDAATNYNTTFYIGIGYLFEEDDPGALVNAIDLDCTAGLNLCGPVASLTEVSSFAVMEPISVSNVNVTCNADLSATVTFDVAGGVPAYVAATGMNPAGDDQFTLTNNGTGTLSTTTTGNATTVTLSNVTGTYDVSVADANGCAQSLAGIWLMPTIDLTPAATKVCEFADDCTTGNTVSLTGVITPQLGTFSFDWTTDNFSSETSWQITNSGGSVAASGGGYPGGSINITDVTAGLDPNETYAITFFDSFGDGWSCGDAANLTITDDGSSTVVYTYTPGEWTSGTCGNTTDADYPNGNGSAFGPFPLGSPTAYIDPVGTISGTGVTDNGDNTGTFDADAAGPGVHTINYTYTSPGGCVLNEDVNITVCANPAAPVAAGTNPTAVCPGDATALAVTDDSVAAPDADPTTADIQTYEWYADNAGSPDIAGGTISTGASYDPGNPFDYSNNTPESRTYHVRAVTHNDNGAVCYGCFTTITLNKDLGCCDVAITSIDNTAELCAGAADGTITVNATSSNPPIMYSNDNGATFQAGNMFTGLTPGTYDIVVMDAQGATCTATGATTVGAGPAVTIVSVFSTPEICMGASNGTITITATADNPTLMYSVDNGATFQASNMFTGLAPGNYDIVVQDGTTPTACTASTTTLIAPGTVCELEISDPCSCLDNATAIDQDNGTGGDDGQFSEVVSVTGPGGTPLPPGLIFTVAAGTTGAFDAYNIPAVGTQSAGVPVATDGSVTLTFNPLNGFYEIPFVHVDDIGYTMAVEGPFAFGDVNNITISVSNKCAYPNPMITEPALDLYCVDAPEVTLAGTEANGAESITFTVNGAAATTFNPSTSAVGMYTIGMSYNGTDNPDGNGGISPDNGITAALPGCIQDVTKVTEVNDTEPPMAMCQDVTVVLDASGNGSTTATAIDNGSSDNCNVQSLAIAPSAFTCANVGANTVTLTVTDVNSNTNTCDATVTVEDNTAPICMTQDITISLDAAGNASITAAAIDNGSSDACGIASLSVAPDAFTCANVGANTVTLTVTDNNTNSNTCDATVTVEDNIAPICMTQDITISLDAAGNASITAAGIDNGSSDACGIASLSVAPDAFTCANVGANTVTLTVTDNNTNSNTCDATVTVEDNTAPICMTQDITIALDAAGNASITAAEIDNGSSDACGIASLSVAPDAFTCANVGANTVTLTVTDNNTNSSSCDATVTVEDNIAPICVTQDITISLDAAGNASITAADIDNGSSDACGIASLSVAPDAFTCANVGANTVTLTVTDNNTNSSSCDATVTVEDNTPPECQTENITVSLDDNGNVSITTADVIGTSFDACGIVTQSLNITDFDCSDLGVNTVLLTLTDTNNNTSVCPAEVTVEDNTPPIVTCRQPISTTTAQGECGAEITLLDPFADDNCGQADLTITNNAPAGNYFEPGTYPVIWTVTDASGNASVCEQDVTIVDNQPPVIASCNTAITFADDNCQAYVTIEADPVDNCGIASITNLGTYTYPVGGIYPIEIVVTDVNGLQTIHNVTVFVHDQIPPTVVECPDDVSVQSDTDLTAVDLPQPSFTDNCSIYSIENNAPDLFATGTTEVVWTAIDAYGLQSTCTYNVEVTQPVVFIYNMAERIEASIEEDSDLARVSWNRPDTEAICELCDTEDIPDFTYLADFYGHQYFLYTGNDSLSWEDAQALAETQLDAHLVAIEDSRENNFLKHLLPEGADNIWIGLNISEDEEGNLQYLWANDKPMSFDNFGAINLPAGNYFASMDENGAWTVTDGLEERSFLVERPCVNLTQTGPYVSVENEEGEPEEVLLESGSLWAAGEYYIKYEAVSLCGDVLTETYPVVVDIEEADLCTTGGADNTVKINRMNFNGFEWQDNTQDGYSDFTMFVIEISDLLPLTPEGEIVEPEFLQIELEPSSEAAEELLYWNVWFDINQDGDFFDSDELVISKPAIGNLFGEVPLEFFNGDATKCRISVSRFGFPEVCADYYSGETEDYKFAYNPREVHAPGYAGRSDESKVPAEELDERKISIMPNPATDLVYLHTPALKNSGELRLLGAKGEMLRSQILQPGLTTHVLKTADLVPGLYFVEIASNGNRVYKKLLIKR